MRLFAETQMLVGQVTATNAHPFAFPPRTGDTGVDRRSPLLLLLLLLLLKSPLIHKRRYRSVMQLIMHSSRHLFRCLIGTD